MISWWVVKGCIVLLIMPQFYLVQFRGMSNIFLDDARDTEVMQQICATR